MPTRRGKDLRLRYDTDRGPPRIVVQRTYRDSDDIELTPITPSLQARLVEGVPVDRSRLQPRHSMCCIPNAANINGRSEMKVIIPHLPATGNHSTHLNELLDHDNGTYRVETVRYFSEGLG